MAKINIKFSEMESIKVESGVSLYEISKYFQKYFNYPILVGKIDNNLSELSDIVSRSCSVKFYDRSSGIGNGVYGRTSQFLLVVAVKKILGPDVDVIINHSIDKGYFCEILNGDLDKKKLKKIEEKMRELSDLNLNIMKTSVPRFDAIDYFSKKNQMDKVRVLKYISNTYISLYRLDDVYDYFYGEIAHDTSSINDFELNYIKNNGFVLSYPTTYNPECTLDYVHHTMLFNTFLEHTNFGKNLGISNAADLNGFVSRGKYAEIIRISENNFNTKLSKIANQIEENKKEVKVVLIAGPSSSGKTTTAKKLSICLEAKGIKTHEMSIDDYFVDRDKTPLLENGELDTESLNCVDLTLFNKNLSDLLEGETVNMPSYNFKLGKREFNDNKLTLGDNDIIIIEGLHGLNEDLTMSIERKNKYKIYISPLTQLNIDNHNRIHTSDTRKLRRIVRDSKFRGSLASETLNMWKQIREGEEKYVFAYQDDADFVLNSALIYEIGLLKTYAEPLLFSVEESDPAYSEALRLINFLRNFLPIPSEEIPMDSVLREFIGGSCFYKKGD